MKKIGAIIAYLFVIATLYLNSKMDFADFDFIGLLATLIMYLGSPVALMIVNVYLLKSNLLRFNFQSSTKKLVVISLIQFLVTFGVVTIMAYIVNIGYGYDGLSMNQVLILLCTGVFAYFIFGYFILTNVVIDKEGLLKLQLTVAFEFITIFAAYFILLYLFSLNVKSFVDVI